LEDVQQDVVIGAVGVETRVEGEGVVFESDAT
jgi:hypothetical protein